MAAGEVCRRKEGETAEENETRRVKRRKLEEEEEVDAESNVVFVQRRDSLVVEGECHQVPTSECDLSDRVSSSLVSCCSNNNRSKEMDEVESRPRRKKKRSCETVKEAELEGFFQAAEKDIRNKTLECSTKYNFDFEKDEPLGGRYAWLKI